MASKYILPIVVVLLFSYAIYFQMKDGSDSYSFSAPNESDTYAQLHTKMLTLLNYEKNSVKWRLCFTRSVVITLTVYGTVFSRWPTPREFVLTSMLIYIGNYIGWNFYTDTVAKGALDTGRKCLHNMTGKRRVIERLPISNG